MVVVGVTAKSLGHDFTDLALYHNSNHQQRCIHRENEATSIKVNFDLTLPLIIHWGGKLLPDINGSAKVDQLPMLVADHGVSKSLVVLKIYIWNWQHSS